MINPHSRDEHKDWDDSEYSELEDEEAQESTAQGYITINQYLNVLRKKSLMPQLITMHEAIEAFHNTSQYHSQSEQVEKTLNVDQFQHVLQVLLTDKELKSGQGMQGNMNGLTSLEIIGLSTREQLMEAMSRNERLEACIYICYISYI